MPILSLKSFCLYLEDEVHSLAGRKESILHRVLVKSSEKKAYER